MQLKPLFNRVIVKRMDPPTTSSGGIVFVGEQEKACHGIVIAVGPGARDKHGVYTPIKMSPGDHILFDKLSGRDIKVDGVPHLVLTEEEIFAVLE